MPLLPRRVCAAAAGEPASMGASGGVCAAVGLASQPGGRVGGGRGDVGDGRGGRRPLDCPAVIPYHRQ